LDDLDKAVGFTDLDITYLNGMLEMMNTVPLDHEIESEINSYVHQAFHRFLQRKRVNSLSSLETLLVGNGFKRLAHSQTNYQLAALWPLICSTSTHFNHMPIFLQSLLNLIQTPTADINLNTPESKNLIDALMESLSSPSHDLRLSALKILDIMVTSRDGESSTILRTAINIEETPPTIETARSISMHIRSLAANYHTISTDQWLYKAIPRFCFGLLHVKFTQLWEDACFVFKEICNTKEGEQVVCETAFQWLEGCETYDDGPNEANNSAKREAYQTDFAGLSFQKLQSLVEKNMALGAAVDELLDTMFQKTHTQAQLTSLFNRTQALKVLKNIPQVAEKRSRSLVPVLLAWSLHMDPDHTTDETEGRDGFSIAPNESHSAQRWARKEQKAMLSLFALFTNPSVLYKSLEVHAALLSLLENGDLEIQKSALQALFAWKNSSIRPYEEDLLKLLDDAKFREQISVFLDIGEGNGSLRDVDRAATMPIILRLLYGRVISRTKGDQQAKVANRKAVFVLLSRFLDSEIREFIDIALGTLRRVSLVDNGIFNQEELRVEYLSERKQFGLLNMLKDLLDTWKSTAAPYVARLVDPSLYCLIRAVRKIGEQESTVSPQDALGRVRSIRHVAIQCLNMLFDIRPDLDWAPYLPILFKELIDPRVEKLAIETAQATSALLRMFATWSHSAYLGPFLVRYNPRLLSKVAECIGHSTSKVEVRRFVTNEVLCALLTVAEGDDIASKEISQILKTHASVFLDQLALLLHSDPPKDLLEDSVQAVVRLADYAIICPADILSSAAFLLQMPAARASHRVKVNLLKILLRFLPTLDSNADASDQIYSAICASFAHFDDKESRILLSSLARTFAERDQSLADVAELCEDLNSFAANRLDEPDYERRTRAFSTINETKYLEFTAKQWRLLLGNLMFYIKDSDETADQKNASYSLRRFVEAASKKTGEEADEFLSIIKGTVLGGIEKGLRRIERGGRGLLKEVQAEYLAVVAHTIKHHPQWHVVSDMKPLLAGNEEASIFVNIPHIQPHRRARALKRMAEEVKLGTISTNNIYHFLLPLTEHFVIDPEEDGTVIAEAVRASAVLVEWIDWQQCRVVLRRFISYVRTKSEMQETVFKLLDAVTTSICRSAALKPEASKSESVVEFGSEGPVSAQPSFTRLAKTMPGMEKMTLYLVQDVIAPLSAFLHDKDESFVSRRISVAVIVARFLQLLPNSEFQIRLPALLTDICNILRSKDQGSRDMTRKALTTICTLIGPTSIGFVLRELKSALQRGFYLHVLSFTVHSILETTTPSFKAGDLDYCANDIMTIIMEDVFGNTGKEKEAQEYLKDKNTKKEVKGKKSFDSMQLLASVTSLTHLVNLIRPIENLLLGRMNLRDARHIDELLRRIELGLLQNESARDRGILVFCYEIVRDAQKVASAKNESSKPRPSKYLAQRTQKPATNSLRSTDTMGRLVRFALEVVRAVLRKNKDLQTPANIAGFMPVIGDALLSNQDDVKLAAIRLFTAVLNIPLPQIDSDAPVYIAEAARIIDDSPTTNDEVSQAALKLISAVLRERRSAPVKVKEKTLAVLLKKMKPDLQVISQQGVAFNLLRSIIARKIVIPEVYEVIDGDDGVAAISVRDHDRTTRDLARGVYFQFLMDCPQGKGRYAKQLTFLVRNLEYEHAEGRQSVMETLHLLLTKVGDSLVQDIVREACWPLVAVMVNDDTPDCREMAAGLVKTVFNRADDEWTKNFLALFRRMLEQGTKNVQKRTALQCWTIYLQVTGSEAKEVEYVQKAVVEILDQEADDFATEEWQLVYYALHTFSAVCKNRPDVAFGKKSHVIWDKVQRHLSFPQSWVKQEAAQLIGSYVADFAGSNAASLSTLPLKGSHGLKLDGSGMCNLAARNLRLLREGVSEELAAQAVRNLAFLGRSFAANGIEWHRSDNSAITEADKQSEDEAESDVDNFMEDPGEAKQTLTATQHLFHVLAGIIRRELRKPSDPSQALYRRADVLHPKTAALQLTVALCTTLPTETLRPSLDTILLPLIHLTDKNITAPTSQDTSFTESYDSLVNNATELMDLLQNKLGTTVYIQVLQRVKKRVQDRRDERRVKRKIQAVSMPERAEKIKKRKREAEKAKRREEGAIARGKRRGW